MVYRTSAVQRGINCMAIKKDMKISIPAFVKWAGGKKQLLHQFNSFFPKKIEKYFDPFVGGGAVTFYILKYHSPKEILISDINEELINAYNIIKNKVEALIEGLGEYKKKHNKEFYYKIRSQDPSKLSDVERAIRFIYLNKTCFNGLYRVNSKGGFNVPIGSYKNPAICPEKDLREISKFLQNVKIKVMPFEKIIQYAKENDFIYFDPPYYPIKKSSFTTYTKDNFLEEGQKKLSKVFNRLSEKGCKVMLSNSDTPFIKSLYKDHKISFVKANRMINCNGNGRGKISEIVVTNYSPIHSQTKL